MMAFDTAWQLHEVLEIMLRVVFIHYIQQLRCVCVCFLCPKHYYYLFAEVSISAIRYIQYITLHTVHMYV